MKISNPTKFSNITNTILKEDLEKQQKLMTFGDVIRLFAATDSLTPSDWHKSKAETDTWVKYSFDGGETWILKFKFKNKLLISSIKNNIARGGTFEDIQEANTNNDALRAGAVHSFDFSNMSDEYFALIRSAVFSFLAVSNDECYTSIPNFRYSFDLDAKKINVMFLEDLPLDTVGIKMNCQLDGSDVLALTLPSSIWTDAEINGTEATQATPNTEPTNTEPTNPSTDQTEPTESN